ncbi:MAG: DUF2961 domain-containing protein [Bacteroidota bacterium]
MMKKLLFILTILSGYAYSQETGVNELTDFDLLPVLRSDILSRQNSSHDHAGGNGDDGFNNQNGNPKYFYGTFNGEDVLLHARGKGIVNRFWITGWDNNQKIKVYFDGKTIPSINKTVADFFSGTINPFLAPLNVNGDVSSGGMISYMPFPFEKEIIITTNSSSFPNAHYFNNINYQMFNKDADITTWTGTEDLSLARGVFENKGSDPRTVQTYASQTNTVDLASGETKSAISISESNQTVTGLFVSIPDLEFVSSANMVISDDGRAHKGYSQFDMNITPDANIVKLVRRMDYWVADQKANVYVDGELAGEWFTPGGDGLTRWRDAEFIIPNALTTGKSTITVKIEFVSAMIDWNEFYYWAYCDDILTDEMDVGNTPGEQAHNYVIVGQNWEGYGEFSYPKDIVNDPLVEILEKVNLQVYYDGETTPAIDAPIGMFFGMGTFERISFQSLAVGVTDGTNQMYCYLPMPFKTSYEVKLTNNYGQVLNGIEASVNYKAYEGDFEKNGYLKTQFRQENPPIAGEDYMFLEETGIGKYIGVVLEVKDTPNSFWLEGDERFYIDGSRTPAFYGTGSEDYFNGAWYFVNGPFGLAQHGFNSFIGTDRTLYRFHLTDPIYFASEAKFGIEHGPQNDEFSDYSSLAYYYHQGNANLTLTDELNIGDVTSETAHAYTVTGTKQEEANRLYFFEGDDDNITVSESGNYIDGSSEFKVIVDPGKQVKIKRMFDYGLADQEADVYVDGVRVGTWYTNGNNEFKRWREEFFIIPAKYTIEKTEITLKFMTISSGFSWSEFHYWIYSQEPDKAPEPPMAVDDLNKGSIMVYPNPANNIINIRTGQDKIEGIRMYDLNGRVVLSIERFNNNYINISNLKNGVYLLEINANGVLETKRIIKH